MDNISKQVKETLDNFKLSMEMRSWSNEQRVRFNKALRLGYTRKFAAIYARKTQHAEEEEREA